MNKKILLVSGHPDLDQSFANKAIIKELQKELPFAEFVFLDKLYSNYQIDVAVEQQHLAKADIIVLQFPFFWYGIPALMKKWMEDVFVHGFSHGSTGNKLSGKKLILSFTSGAPETLYKHGGLQNYAIDEFLPPLKQFANLCGMEWVDYVYSGGLSYQNRNDKDKLKQMQESVMAHAEKLIAKIQSVY